MYRSTCKYKPWIENSWKEKGYLLEDKQGGKTYMEDIDKIVSEVARKES